MSTTEGKQLPWLIQIPATPAPNHPAHSAIGAGLLLVVLFDDLEESAMVRGYKTCQLLNLEPIKNRAGKPEVATLDIKAAPPGEQIFGDEALDLLSLAGGAVMFLPLLIEINPTKEALANIKPISIEGGALSRTVQHLIEKYRQAGILFVGKTPGAASKDTPQPPPAS